MKKALITGSAFFLPAVAFAQTGGGTSGNVTNLLYLALNIVNLVIPLLIAIALVVFFWGLIKYISGAGGEGGHEQGRKIMIAGIVALFIMVSIWGIIRVIGNTLGIQPGGQQFVAPTVQYTP